MKCMHKNMMNTVHKIKQLIMVSTCCEHFTCFCSPVHIHYTCTYMKHVGVVQARPNNYFIQLQENSHIKCHKGCCGYMHDVTMTLCAPSIKMYTRICSCGFQTLLMDRYNYMYLYFSVLNSWYEI